MRKTDPVSKVQRRLAAIFSADVEGYTRLMNADEAGTMRLLTSHRDITDRFIAQHGGRIANTAGDSILAEFPSAVDALQCSLGILERVAAVNQEIPEERRVRFRIGLHAGEVMVKDGDLYGDGVNVAARMQGLAQPGSICLSEAAHQFVHRMLPVTFEDLGPQLVKNLDGAIRAYSVRPSGEPASPALPPVHRRAEAHLARRYHDLCRGAVLSVTSEEDLTPLEFAVLASLNDAPGIDPRRLSGRIGIDATTAQRLLKRLKNRELVVAQVPARENRRSGRLSLTPQGAKVLQTLRPAVIAATDRVMATLSDRERETLRELLARVINANETKDKPEQAT
ncbi:MAG TPA: adenylate/guanylate cyclase domain-containing protein [Candidatus Cybelea sp.]|nr:adenylate/guanylate cyclase domain-containing protein [Candidatus Cybelea sp.]